MRSIDKPKVWLNVHWFFMVIYVNCKKLLLLCALNTVLYVHSVKIKNHLN